MIKSYKSNSSGFDLKTFVDKIGIVSDQLAVQQPKLIKRMKILEERDEYLTNELELIDWYAKFFDEGQDTKEVISLYYTLQESHRLLMVKHNETCERMSTKIKK